MSTEPSDDKSLATELCSYLYLFAKIKEEIQREISKFDNIIWKDVRGTLCHVTDTPEARVHRSATKIMNLLQANSCWIEEKRKTVLQDLGARSVMEGLTYLAEKKHTLFEAYQERNVPIAKLVRISGLDGSSEDLAVIEERMQNTWD
jgi:hypothetical protein